MKTNVLLHLASRINSIRMTMMVLVAVFATSMAISQTTVVDIIVNSPDHTTLEAAVIAAKLDDDLSGTGPFTVFAPTDDAFDALPDGVLDDLLADPEGALAQVLLYHVVPGDLDASEVLSQGWLKTAEGRTLKARVVEGEVYINNAKVISPNIEAENGTIHAIDRVLIPWFRH